MCHPSSRRVACCRVFSYVTTHTTSRSSSSCQQHHAHESYLSRHPFRRTRILHLCIPFSHTMSESNRSDNTANGRNTTSTSHDFRKATHFLSSSTVSKPEFHHALVISKINNHIPIVLEMKKDQYGTWTELFRIYALSHRVLYHIVPSKDKISLQIPLVSSMNSGPLLTLLSFSGYIPHFSLTC